MKFDWNKWKEKRSERKNTLQVFITNKCNLECKGCFARKIIGGNRTDMELSEYKQAVENFISKEGEKINLLGGEPLLHPQLKEILRHNSSKNLSTTIYTNGYYLGEYNKEDLENAKLRASIYSYNEGIKSATNLPLTEAPLDTCYMVSSNTKLESLLKSAEHMEKNYDCNVFFISSIRELDNERKEFFDDTDLTMPLIEYKELVHKFLEEYEGNMEIHVSKRGVFESTLNTGSNKCKFSNYFIGGQIIQCPYDIVNSRFQEDYSFDNRYCQQNNSCLMTKVIFERK